MCEKLDVGVRVGKLSKRNLMRHTAATCVKKVRLIAALANGNERQKCPQPIPGVHGELPIFVPCEEAAEDRLHDVFRV